jgi:glycosyltransferase involved in cell wall biosynthesis
MKLTVGMAVYGDFDGVYFTVQSLRMYHPQIDEIIVVDNRGDNELKEWLEYWGKDKCRYIEYTDTVGTTAPRQKVFEEATGDFVYCIDSHVLIAPGGFSKLYDGPDLVHGVMCYDDFSYVTHMKNEWNDNMWGVWGDIVSELPVEAIEIPMHGLGLFGCRKDAWLGFNSDFRGFGGEEGYIHEKFRKSGRKVLCLPWLQWCHRFGKSGPYPLNGNDRIRNYLLGFKELGLDPKPIYNHFGIRTVNHVASSIDR